MNVFAITGAAIAAAALSVILRQYNKEYGLYISLCASVLIFISVLAAFSPITSFIKTLSETIDTSSEYIAILFKALSVCYIIQLASDCCKDCGESAIASKIDFAGKIALLLISLPLFETLLNIVKELIN